MRETILPIGLPLLEKYVVPDGFERCFITYDKDSKQVILCLTDKAKDTFPRSK